MKDAFSLVTIRSELGRPWLIVLFGIAYVISQATIIVILGPIEDAMIKLQTTGFSASDYLTVFRAWDASGEMALYRAHFILDDYHWIWYALLFTALLSWLFERQEIAHKYNWVLLLPMASGLLDWYENRIQHIFLSAGDYSTIVDPLPLYSTLASDVKWAFALAYFGLSLVLIVKCWLRRKSN